MLCCEVSKIAAMIVATTLPDHLHFYCTTKEKLQSALKFLNCEKYIFVKKTNIIMAAVCLGFVWLGLKGLIN